MISSKQTLVLLPGLMCDETVWHAQVEHFRGRFSIQVMDYGERNSLPSMAVHVLSQAPARFALAGHSMGGRIALEVMRLAPDRIIALALLDTGCHELAHGAGGETERRERLRLVNVARHEGVAAMARDWVKTMVHASRLEDAALIDPILAMFQRKTAAVFEAQVNALLTRPEAFPLLPEIECPTLILAGRDDRLSPPAANLEMAAAIRGARQVTLEECGHMAPQEKPDAVNHHLEALLFPDP